MIGGGAYSYPKDFLGNNREGSIDVVEIDPEITNLAFKYFNLEKNSRLRVYHLDGRIFLNKTEERYDAVLMDAFSSSSAIPFQLATKEVAQRIYEILSDEGVVIINTISSIEGNKGKFIRAEYYTFKSVFPQVYLFSVRGGGDGRLVGNIMLVALKSQKKPLFSSVDDQFNELLSHLWTKEVKKDMPILTDDFAPVEQYIAEIY